MTRFRTRGTSCWDFHRVALLHYFPSVPISTPQRFLRNSGIEKILLVQPIFQTLRWMERFVLTRGNNFLGLIANYVTHCVSLNTILSKHSCFGLKQIVLWDRQGLESVLRISMENRIVIFLLERILEALQLSRLDVCCSFQELWLLKLSNVCTHESTRNYRAILRPTRSFPLLSLTFSTRLLSYRANRIFLAISRSNEPSVEHVSLLKFLYS